MQKPAFALIRNPVSLLGAIFVALAAFLIVVLSALLLVGHTGDWRLHTLAYVLLPAVLGLGVVLLVIGLWLQRHDERKAAAGRGAAPPPLPVIDLNERATRRTLLAALLLGGLGLLIFAGAGVQGVQFMESTVFCTQACHTTMHPEGSSHARSVHANVTCADCHVGPGVKWFVKSKIHGTQELIEVVTNTTPRPVPTPIHNLRPAGEVCGQCHSTNQFIGDRLIVRTRFGEDAANTPTKTVLMLHVGGEQGGTISGAHWHASPSTRIRYLADPARRTVYMVELDTPGMQKTFKGEASPPANAQWRVMDCVDCHNRAAHPFGTAANEVDAALADGRIDTSLPFIRREGLRVLQASYPTQEKAREAIGNEIVTFYEKTYPDVAAGQSPAVRRAGKALGDIWSANVFPQMNVTWDTYPNHLGHQQSPGCFRCHDNKHAAADGTKISKNCGLCHHLVAQDEAAPEALKGLE